MYRTQYVRKTPKVAALMRRNAGEKVPKIKTIIVPEKSGNKERTKHSKIVKKTKFVKKKPKTIKKVFRKTTKSVKKKPERKKTKKVKVVKARIYKNPAYELKQKKRLRAQKNKLKSLLKKSKAEKKKMKAYMTWKANTPPKERFKPVAAPPTPPTKPTNGNKM